jgi:hypothetical protein
MMIGAAPDAHELSLFWTGLWGYWVFLEVASLPLMFDGANPTGAAFRHREMRSANDITMKN